MPWSRLRAAGPAVGRGRRPARGQRGQRHPRDADERARPRGRPAAGSHRPRAGRRAAHRPRPSLQRRPGRRPARRWPPCCATSTWWPACVADVDDDARVMLDHLDRSGSEGTTQSARAQVRRADATTPVEQLLARGLLRPARRPPRRRTPRGGDGAARRPHHPRAGRTGRPPLATASRSATLVDRAAAGAAYELVHRTELLLDEWSARPPTVLRQGGLGVRDLKATAALLHADERVAALLRGDRRPPPDCWPRARPTTSTWPGCRRTRTTRGGPRRPPSAGRRWSAAWWANPRPAGYVGRAVRGNDGQRPVPRAGAAAGLSRPGAAPSVELAALPRGTRARPVRPV